MFYTQAMHIESTPDIHWHTYALTLPSPSPDVGILAPQTDILPEALSQNRKTSIHVPVSALDQKPLTQNLLIRRLKLVFESRG